MPFDHFDLLAPIYEKVIPASATEAMLRELNPSPSCRLLDAGGGTGRVSGSLQEHVGSVVLSDISMGMLKQAAEKDNLRPTCALTEAMPFADDYFDCVLMVDALHHVNDQVQTARELWRIIKPGGRIVIQEPDIRRFSVKLIAIAEKLALMRSHFLAPQKIANLFPFDGVEVDVHTEDFSAWVVVKKK
ncbi:MAG: class I SAM-dependent methyltransferase [Anaerolineae bacterium]|jgi:ubiquinone/menaquinone biosynthesis C-methylase UbiE|nr:class I SAM-dependent methyltransferase [Anaerolineae bacterium]MBT7071212.1 class I SAM-dependent methyltransferase [Anaerolineae bacterium]MBT7324124.1 class I SAM-dependent methyltransferase [Anaerolineae bacterium]